MKKDSALGKKVRQQTEQDKYIGTHLSKKLIVMALLHAPKLGLEAAATMMGLFVASFLANMGLLGLSTVPKSTPCTKTMPRILIEATAGSILLERESMHSLPLTLLVDKGDGKGHRD